MDITADLEVCEGHGLCAQTAPDVYALDDEGYVQLLHEHPDPSLEASARAGARVCPVAALTVTS